MDIRGDDINFPHMTFEQEDARRILEHAEEMTALAGELVDVDEEKYVFRQAGIRRDSANSRGWTSFHEQACANFPRLSCIRPHDRFTFESWMKIIIFN